MWHMCPTLSPGDGCLGQQDHQGGGGMGPHTSEMIRYQSQGSVVTAEEDLYFVR